MLGAALPENGTGMPNRLEELDESADVQKTGSYHPPVPKPNCCEIYCSDGMKTKLQKGVLFTDFNFHIKTRL